MKHFLSNTQDTYRRAYGRFTEIVPRQCVFIGTINPEGDGTYLRDVTGNRRFWPVRTGKISIAKLEKDRDQLFAEAMVRYHQGEEFYLKDRAVEILAEKEQMERSSSDPWEDVIERWLDKEERNNTPVYRTTVTRVLQEALGLDASKIGRIEQGRVINILINRWSWARRSVRIKEENQKVCRAFINPKWDTYKDSKYENAEDL